MSNRGNNRGFRSLILNLAWCVGLAGIVFLLPARFTAPARTLFLQASGPLQHGVYSGAGDAAAASGTLRDALLSEEKRRLSATEAERLENENRLLKESVRRLRRHIEHYEALGDATAETLGLTAAVIAYDAARPRSSIAVAAGTRQGLSGEELVTARGAVVGTVAEPGPFYSRVRLLTDPASRLPVRCRRTRTLYVLKGENGNKCRLELTDREQDIQTGDILVTAPLIENPMPEGIPVAQVTSVKDDKVNPLFRSVEARPLVNVDRLEQVVVIQKE